MVSKHHMHVRGCPHVAHMYSVHPQLVESRSLYPEDGDECDLLLVVTHRVTTLLAQVPIQ